jgi:phosphoribosylformylglycinamidine synthase PurS subunit
MPIHRLKSQQVKWYEPPHLDRPLGETMAIVVVDVALKPEILDPQGRAIVGALGRVGLSGVADVRQGKQFVLTIDGDIDEAKLAQINEIASTLLSNPVIENFTVQVRP